MLNLDVNALTEKQLQSAVGSACARYGTVKQVEVCFDLRRPDMQAFALVYMATGAQSCQLVAAFGGKIVGPAVLLPLHDDGMSQLVDACRVTSDAASRNAPQ